MKKKECKQEHRRIKIQQICRNCKHYAHRKQACIIGYDIIDQNFTETEKLRKEENKREKE